MKKFAGASVATVGNSLSRVKFKSGIDIREEGKDEDKDGDEDDDKRDAVKGSVDSSLLLLQQTSIADDFSASSADVLFRLFFLANRADRRDSRELSNSSSMQLRSQQANVV